MTSGKKRCRGKGKKWGGYRFRARRACPFRFAVTDAPNRREQPPERPIVECEVPKTAGADRLCSMYYLVPRDGPGGGHMENAV